MEYYKFAKPHSNMGFVFVITAPLATREILLTKGFPLDGAFLHTNVTNRTDQLDGVNTEATHYPQSLALTIVAKGYNTCHAQDPVSTTLHTLMDKGNITNINFNKVESDILNRHDGITFFQCSNLSCTSPWGVPGTPWAQEGPRSDTQDVWRHWLEGPSDPSVDEGPRHWEHLPPTEIRRHKGKAISCA